jgi:hypothetical protein
LRIIFNLSLFPLKPDHLVHLPEKYTSADEEDLKLDFSGTSSWDRPGQIKRRRLRASNHLLEITQFTKLTMLNGVAGSFLDLAVRPRAIDLTGSD